MMAPDLTSTGTVSSGTSYGGSASLRFHENWRAFASGTYDLEENFLAKNSIGFAYDDECFIYTMTFSQSRASATAEADNTFGVSLSLRTIGDFGTTSSEVTGFSN